MSNNKQSSNHIPDVGNKGSSSVEQKIIYTNDYALILSEEQIKDVRQYEGKYHLEKDLTINRFPNYLTDLSECKLIISHRPLNNAPILDGVPLFNNNQQQKQNSIEWYREQLMKILFDSRDNTLIYEIDIFNQAKAMHKEEIVNAVDGFPIHTRHLNGEDYYNEIYRSRDDNSNKLRLIDQAITQIEEKIIQSRTDNTTTRRTGDYRIGLNEAKVILESLKENYENKIESAQEFNNKYKDYLEEGYNGLEIDIPLLTKWLDKKFEQFIIKPNFKYSQIKAKYGMGRFYCIGLLNEEVEEVESFITDLID